MECPLSIYSSFRTVAESYIQQLEKRTNNALFSKQFRSSLRRHAYPYIEQVAIIDVTKPQLESIISTMRHKGESISSVYLFVDNLKRLFRYAQVRNLLLDNPCQGIKVPYPWRFGCRHFSDQESAQLLFGFSKCNYPELFKFSFVSGLPIRICAAFKRSNLNFTNGVYHITEEVVFKRCRHSCSSIVPVATPRFITLPRTCLEMLALLPKNETDLFFPSPKGTCITRHDIASCLLYIQYYSGISDFSTHQIVENYIYECIDIGVDTVSLEEYYDYARGYILNTYGWVNPELAPSSKLPGNIAWRSL